MFDIQSNSGWEVFLKYILKNKKCFKLDYHIRLMDLSLLSVSTFILTSLLIWLIIGFRWQRWKMFFHNSYSYIDLSFILLYFFEQVGLSYLVYLGFNAQLMAGIFSLIIITTASIQNKCWESRTRKINEKFLEQNVIIKKLRDTNERVLLDNKDLNRDLTNSKLLIEKLFLKLKKSQEILSKQKSKK